MHRTASPPSPPPASHGSLLRHQPAGPGRHTFCTYRGGVEIRQSGLCSRPVVWTTFPSSSGSQLVCTTASQALPDKTSWSGASWLPGCRLLLQPSLVPLAPPAPPPSQANPAPGPAPPLQVLRGVEEQQGADRADIAGETPQPLLGLIFRFRLGAHTHGEVLQLLLGWGDGK